MKMTNVTSSNIKAIGYEISINAEDKIGTLRIEFVHGATYDYRNVPESVAKDFLAVESKGSFFHRKIRDKYTSIRVSG